MAAFFVDLDGTIFQFGTNNFTTDAQKLLTWLKDNNHQLIIITRRGNEFEGHPIFDKRKTIEALKKLEIEYDEILFDIISPRIIINDDICRAYQVDKNKGVSKILEFIIEDGDE